MYLKILTPLHVAISLAGIFSGLIVACGLLTGARLDGWNAFFLATTVATSVTGFFFPVDRFLPSHAFGIVSLVLLAIAIYARYSRDLAGGWNTAYIVTALISLYLNVFVGVVQSFLKIPRLNTFAPTQTEIPFILTQLVVLALFVLLTIAAVMAIPVASAP